MKNYDVYSFVRDNEYLYSDKDASRLMDDILSESENRVNVFKFFQKNK